MAKLQRFFNRKLKQLLAKPQHFKRAMALYGPYLGAAIKVDHISADFKNITVSMGLTWYNRNYHGTQFGGSLFSMTDPFYVLMLVRLMGKNYTIWDAAANIEYKKPGTGRVFANFTISDAQLDDLKKQAATGKAIFPEFALDIVDKNQQVIATVNKKLYIKLNTKQA